MTHTALRPVIGLTMIVRDEAETIEACLRSVLPHVDRALIVDTGSTDGTPDLIAKIAAPFPGTAVRVEHAEWPGHFGEARQSALDRLLAVFPETTHVIWLDGDDVLVGGENLRFMAEHLSPGCGALTIHYDYARDEAGHMIGSGFRERLVRVEAIEGWRGMLHEHLMLRPGWGCVPAPAPSSSALAQTHPDLVLDDGVEIVHKRPASHDSGARNRAMLEAEIGRRRESGMSPDPNLLLQLALELASCGIEACERFDAHEDPADRETMITDLERAIDLLAEFDGIADSTVERYRARHHRADYLRLLDRADEALALGHTAIELIPDWADAWFGVAASYITLGNPAAALAYADVGLSKPAPDPTMFAVNPHADSVGAWTIKATALSQLGREDEAQAWWDRAGRADASLTAPAGTGAA